MKQIVLSLLTLLLSVGVAGAAVKEAQVKIDFPVGTVKSLTLVNKNGRIEIDRVVGKRDIVINVSVVCNGKTEADAQKMLDGISIDKAVNGTAAAVNTITPNGKSFKELFTGADWSVNYRVTVPWGVELNIVNENGAITVPNYGDRLSIQSVNCNVYVGDVTSETPCLLDIKRGNCVLKGAELLNANLEGCKYEFDRVVSGTIKAKNCTGTIESATIANLTLTGGSLAINRAEDISGAATDCDLSIADLGDCLTLDMLRRSLVVSKIHFSFDKIMVNAIWADVDFTFMEDSGYNLTLQHDKRLKVDLPSDLKLGRMSSAKKKAMIGTGYYGNPARQSDVRVRMTAGSLKIR